MKKLLATLLGLSMWMSMTACSFEEIPETTPSANAAATSVAESDLKYHKYATMTPEEIVAQLTLEQKAAQMVQPAIYNVTESQMLECDYGSILSKEDTIEAVQWRALVDGYQQAAIQSEAGIPYIYGQDDVHGVNYCLNAVYFPHNIGLGAANDEELMYQVGLITADEAKLCHMLWNFAPCVAQSQDPRWGRTYESYGADIATITRLSTAYTRGLVDGGAVACAKHFFGDGNVAYGTGENSGGESRLMDRGAATLSEDQINQLLSVYQAQIDAGVQTIMVSFSSLNGVKMHENQSYIMKLKNEMGFEGFIVSDWDGVQGTSGSSYQEQVINCVNAGVDMFMETGAYEACRRIIVEAVQDGRISEERVNDAVTRIIRVKQNEGLFDDPLCENMKTVQEETGSEEYRRVAEKLVEESLVLLKNDHDILPLRAGTKVYITGPAADNAQAQCGGWTIDWMGSPSRMISGVTTITEAFTKYATEYGIEVITNADQADQADVVILCVGECSYAEWHGDTPDMKLCGYQGLGGNEKAIAEAQELGKPTVTCIVAGRQVILPPEDYANWDSVVMCYLPGSEGKGIADVLCGCADFTGRLPSPWYGSIEQIGTNECFLPMGYGLSYGDGFVPREEAAAGQTEIIEINAFAEMAEGTKYTSGYVFDGCYVNSYAQIKMDIPSSFTERIDQKDLLPLALDTIDSCTNEKDKAREAATIWDYSFANGADSILFTYTNIEKAAPDVQEYSAENYLDDYRTYMTGNLAAQGVTVEIAERATVSLGGEKYVRDTYILKEQGTEKTTYVYARKLDDKLICSFQVRAQLPLEKFEGLFK